MKKTLMVLLAVSVLSVMAAGAKDQKTKWNKVVYCTSMDCENCAKKITENVSFERGVRDLKVDVATKMVEIQFDASKTDTLKLGQAIKDLGYEARVVEFSETK